MYICNMTHSHIWRDSSTCVTIWVPRRYSFGKSNQKTGSKLEKWRKGIDSVGIYPSSPRLALSTLEFFEGTRCLRDVFDLYAKSFDICVSISAILALAVSSSMVLAVYVTLSIRMTELFVWVPRRCRLGGDYLGGTCCLCDVVRVYCQVICVSTSLKCVTWLIHWFDMRHVTCLGGMSHMWMSHDMYMNTCMSDDMHMRSHALEACHMPRRYSASSFSSKIDVCVYIDTKSLHTYKHTTKRMTGSFVRVSHRFYRVAKTHRLP